MVLSIRVRFSFIDLIWPMNYYNEFVSEGGVL